MTIISFKEFLLNEAIEIERKAKEVVSTATGKDSEYFTKIAKRLLEIEAAERKLTDMKNEVKGQLREDVAKIFDKAEDALKTRKIETLSVFITLSKNPEPRQVVQWKEVVVELMSLFEDLHEQIESIIQKYTKYVETDPSVRVSIKDPDLFKESAIGDIGSKISEFWKKFRNWLNRFDKKLISIKKKIRRYSLSY